MKKLNILALLSFMFVTVGLLSSCQKDEASKSDELNSVLKNAVVYDCSECVETWADTRVTFDATHFVPQSPLGHMPTNLYLDIYNDATTVYFKLYRLNGATIGYLQIGENGTPMTFAPAVTEYSWTQPLPADWEACDKINLFLIVGGVGQYVGHANFCEDYYFRDICETYECEGPTETAWVAGTPYVEKGNWATYTPYLPNTTVNIYAGQHNLAGTAHFSAVVNGEVTITFSLVDGWIFNDVEESLKIMTYMNTPPAKNPAPGQFTYKYDATGNTYTVTLPEAMYYGIHLDLMHCELEY